MKNIVKLTGTYNLNVRPLHLYNMPNLTDINDPYGMLTNYLQNANLVTSTAFYLPKVEHFSNPFYYWYGNGELRWIVIGINNGGKVITTTYTNANFNMKKRPVGIFVPNELVDAYKSDEYWSKYASYIHGISEFKTLVTDVTGEELPSEV